MRAQTIAMVSLLFAIACGGATGATEPADPPRATCGDLIERYRAVLAEGSGRCASDADCAVYGGLDPENVCGGSTDAETARRLREIGEESAAAGCPRPGYSCPPIVVRCADGLCR